MRNNEFHHFSPEILATQKEKFPIVTPYDLIAKVWDSLSPKQKSTISKDDFRNIIITQQEESVVKMFGTTAESSLDPILEQFYLSKVRAFKQRQVRDTVDCGMFSPQTDNGCPATSTEENTATASANGSTPLSKKKI